MKPVKRRRKQQQRGFGKQAMLAEHRISTRLPSGVILSRSVEAGGRLFSAGTPALVLGQNSQGFVFRVPVVDRDASKLRVGMPAEISIESLDGDPISATISEIDGPCQ